MQLWRLSPDLQGVFSRPSFAQDFSQFEGGGTGCRGQKQGVTAAKRVGLVPKERNAAIPPESALMQVRPRFGPDRVFRFLDGWPVFLNDHFNRFDQWGFSVFRLGPSFRVKFLYVIRRA